MYFLAFPFVLVFFHVLFVLHICSMVSWTHLVFKFAGYCLFNNMSVSFSHCNAVVQIISFNLTLTSIKEFCGFPFQFPFLFYLCFSLYNSYFLFILFFFFSKKLLIGTLVAVSFKSDLALVSVPGTSLPCGIPKCMSAQVSYVKWCCPWDIPTQIHLPAYFKPTLHFLKIS